MFHQHLRAVSEKQHRIAKILSNKMSAFHSQLKAQDKNINYLVDVRRVPKVYVAFLLEIARRRRSTSFLKIELRTANLRYVFFVSLCTCFWCAFSREVLSLFSSFIHLHHILTNFMQLFLITYLQFHAHAASVHPIHIPFLPSTPHSYQIESITRTRNGTP